MRGGFGNEGLSSFLAAGEGGKTISVLTERFAGTGFFRINHNMNAARYQPGARVIVKDGECDIIGKETKLK